MDTTWKGRNQNIAICGRSDRIQKQPQKFDQRTSTSDNPFTKVSGYKFTQRGQ